MGRVDGLEHGKGRAVPPIHQPGLWFFWGSRDACEKAMRRVVDPPSAARVRNLIYIKLTFQIHKQKNKKTNKQNTPQQKHESLIRYSRLMSQLRVKLNKDRLNFDMKLQCSLTEVKKYWLILLKTNVVSSKRFCAQEPTHFLNSILNFCKVI